jgi:hypothetical protein
LFFTHLFCLAVYKQDAQSLLAAMEVRVAEQAAQLETTTRSLAAEKVVRVCVLIEMCVFGVHLVVFCRLGRNNALEKRCGGPHGL